MALQATQKSTIAGLNPVYAAANAGGDTFVNTGNEQVKIKCGATGCVATFVAQGACNHGTLHNGTVTVPANQERIIGPFRDTQRWNNASQQVSITYDQVSTVTIAIVSD